MGYGTSSPCGNTLPEHRSLNSTIRDSHVRLPCLSCLITFKLSYINIPRHTQRLPDSWDSNYLKIVSTMHRIQRRTVEYQQAEFVQCLRQTAKKRMYLLTQNFGRTYISLLTIIPSQKNLDALDIFRDAKTAVCARKILFIQYYIAYIMHTKHIDRRCINACVCAFVFQKIAPT